MEKLKKEYNEILGRFATQKREIHRLWNVGIETAELLSLLAFIHKPKIILELGTSNGYSTFHLALSKTSKIYTIDVEEARQSLAKKNLQTFDNIIFISERIEEYLPKIDYKINMLFIDANKPNYLKYLLILEKHLDNNAIIIADNIDSHFETISVFNEYILNSNKYTTIHLSIEAGLLISIYHKGECVKNEKIKIQNQENTGLNKLLNPLEKPKKESKLDELLQEIEDMQKEEKGE